MLYNTLHRRWPRLIAAVLGQFIVAASQNLFIVPMGLYAGGITGVCQLIRTLLQTHFGLDFGPHDIAGILFFIANIPLLLMGYRTLGKSVVGKTFLCIVSYSLFYSIIPIPTTPIVKDYLTACLLGGILGGIGCGIVLTAGGSSGGLDIVGLCMAKKGSRFTVGRFSLSFNAVLYAVFLVLFIPEVTIYSLIYNFILSLVLDRVHQQNVSVQALIFTKTDEQALADFIIERLGRSVTWWNGTGAYTGEDVNVLCVCLSKFEIDELLHMVHSIDPHAFLTVQEGVHIYGNFAKKLQ